ncbi:esterase/lipase family protein [Microbacterium sp. NPDC058062]|uniref:esterase/lipase family protein n=1 Tax=Microbacterium sp. NPDC058062 TaxID=3346320 RepID=UPI0036DAA2C9
MAHASVLPPKRLVIFVHGFLGNATRTWAGMLPTPPDHPFWQEADLVFVGYRSFVDTIKSTSDRFRRRLAAYYPTPAPLLSQARGVAGGDVGVLNYEQLILVGHSLGGMVIRRALVDDFRIWRASGGALSVAPVTLGATVRLFSPATAGYRGAGLLSLIRTGASSPAVLRFSSAFADMQAGSTFLADTREKTEAYGAEPLGHGLRARIAWASPENVVETVPYDTDDYDETIRMKRDHIQVCKPVLGYSTPWDFIENGLV